VATFLATLLGRSYDAQRQQLREFCYDAADKRGQQRRQVEVTACFAPLLRWVLAWWPRGEKRLALALDATTLGQRFTVLAISVVYGGCAIPVAWTVVSATKKGAWRPHWEELLAHLAEAVPADWVVLVLADRGLYARWLYQAIKRQEWHPFLRINHQGQYRPAGRTRFQPLATVVRQGEAGWSGAVECFASSCARLPCTLLAQWTPAHRDPWLILTDLPPEVAQIAWYSLRMWIECGFSDLKRGGWDWQQTKMSDPARASRLWLVLAVATFAVVRAGGMAQSGLEALAWDGLPDLAPVRPRGSRPRLLSCFRLGVLRILVALVRGRHLPRGRLQPVPWPTALPSASAAPRAA
jgi:DDE family transposase